MTLKPLSDGEPNGRGHPLTIVTLAMIALVAVAGFVGPLPSKNLLAVALCVVLPFWVSVAGDWRRARIGLAVLVVGFVAAFELSIGPATVACIAWFGGRLLHDRNQLVRQLATTNRELALEWSAQDRALVMAERARVAREMHDVLGHSLTVIVLQAGASRRMWERDHVRAMAALATIRQVATDGMAELLTALGSLDSSTDDVLKLIEGARRAGLRVDFTFDEAEPAIGLVGYRVIQEGLTNVLKHAPYARAAVHIGRSGGGVELAVINPVRDRGRARSASMGRGLEGMRERVEGCGGSIEWGSSNKGEFALRARLPG